METIEFKSKHFDFVADSDFKNYFNEECIKADSIGKIIKKIANTEKLDYITLKIVRNNIVIGGLSLSALSESKAVTYISIFNQYKNYPMENKDNYDFTGIVLKEWIEKLNERFIHLSEIVAVVKSKDYNIVKQYTKKDIEAVDDNIGFVKVKRDLRPCYIICGRKYKK